ncbi:MAG: hypothetical protein DRJ33_07970 [Candidatus Methanomethylicota archaeon]|uniref:Copper amine oxidase n=1 Tax=Thermoproteota archaeon TaxID=2056631 RepID=A0A497ERB7_9CREN|nr:MAG: hypothetical protein DRJ33_07970 [Candidatus Verstraetearchaeota archaeon]
MGIRTALLLLVLATIAFTVSSNMLCASNSQREVANDNDLVKRFDSFSEMVSYIKAFNELDLEAVKIPYPAFIEEVRGATPANIANDLAFKITVAKAVETSIKYSKTNVQVAGVEEADIVKSDGEYLYIAKGDHVVILKAYPPDEMRVVSEITLKGYVSGIFICGERLIAICSSTPKVSPLPFIEYKVVPYREQVSIAVYDISNKEDPKLVDDDEVSGHFVNARMLDKFCYVIVQQPAYILGQVVLPVINGETIPATDVAYFEEDLPQVFTIVLAIDTEDGSLSKEVFLTGASSYVYMSKENLYLISQRIENVFYVLQEVVKIMNLSLPDASFKNSLVKIAPQLEESFNRLPPDKRLEIWKKISKATLKQTTETVIYRFSVEKLSLKAEAKGSVPGKVLDQFSMDEYEGFFRIATTSEDIEGRRNNVYVLDMDLNIVGKLEGLAEGERIYAARYLGDKMFLVTFKTIDPLFAIDLADPTHPKVVGYLKMPGFSEYIHPYEHYLIGVGRHADMNGRVRCLKISLVDISNLEEPTEISSIIIDEATWSPIFTDHKAFAINLDKKYMAVPAYGLKNGIYIIDFSEDSLNVKGFVKHPGARRAAFIEDYIYTVSQDIVKALDDSTLVLLSELSLADMIV